MKSQKKPVKRRIVPAVPENKRHMLDAEGEKCLYCEQSETVVDPDVVCPARNTVPGDDSKRYPLGEAQLERDIDDQLARIRSERHRCQNCDWTGPEDQLKNADNIPDLFQRVAPGEPMPSGECPQCGSLCHPVETETEECDCADRSWYGEAHDTACPLAGQPNAGSLVRKKAIPMTDEKFTDALDELLNHALKLVFPFLTKRNVVDIVAEVKRHFNTHFSTELSIVNGVVPNDEVDLANQTVLGLRDSFKLLRRK